MRLNTTKSQKLARRVKGRFGTWQAVREASKRENGIYVIEGQDSSNQAHPELKPQPITA